MDGRIKRLDVPLILGVYDIDVLGDGIFPENAVALRLPVFHDAYGAGDGNKRRYLYVRRPNRRVGCWSRWLPVMQSSEN